MVGTDDPGSESEAKIEYQLNSTWVVTDYAIANDPNSELKGVGLPHTVSHITTTTSRI
jgi:hypothetical protein